ncbi:MAG: putative DNA-binding domain-containing protein [Nitratireductor sp.]|nr:putative DNA-binding domain-containing protein [Nitratireductor sp.]
MIGDLPASDVDGEAIRLSGFSAALFDSDLEVPAGIGRQGLPAPRRFAVYRNTVIVSLLEALRSTFPSLLAIMGAETFDRVARVFISRHPPRSAMMQAYGDRFADFLTGFKPLAGSPFLADVARAERAWLDAYHAADAPVLTGGMLADLTPEKAQTLRLKRHPAATMIASSYPLFDLFRAREVWPRPGVDLEEPQTVLITRPEYQCGVIGLDAAQTTFFAALFEGATLGEALGAAIDLNGALDAPAAIALMLQSGAFAAPSANAS